MGRRPVPACFINGLEQKRCCTRVFSFEPLLSFVFVRNFILVELFCV